jgi:hypothetical protein
MNKSYPYSPKLKMWFIESYMEIGYAYADAYTKLNESNQDYAIFPQRFYKQVEAMSQIKNYDYCFIGSFWIDSMTVINRYWLLDFISSKFTDHSYLQFTDSVTKSKHVSLGVFDQTLLRKGMTPKEIPLADRNFFDNYYFATMCMSQFCLCPAGDSMYSMRFYEALMCKSIPVVKTIEETYRTQKESNLGYKFYFDSDEHYYRLDWIEHNYNLFLEYHTLM